MRTTTDAANWHFEFTVSDLGRFLGKSPVTLRGWESKGLIQFPREAGGDRRFTLVDIGRMAKRARELGRISEDRLQLVLASATLLKVIEKENVK